MSDLYRTTSSTAVVTDRVGAVDVFQILPGTDPALREASHRRDHRESGVGAGNL